MNGKGLKGTIVQWQ